MSGYHHPPPSHSETTAAWYYMQPPHPQAAAAHPYPHQQRTVATASGDPAALTTTTAPCNNPAASYYYPFEYQRQQQATASAAQAPPSVEQLPSSRLAHTQRTMQQTGYHNWGFVVYRGAYGDDAAWQRYLQHLKHEVAQAADSSTSTTAAATSATTSTGGEQQPPSQSLTWTVLENRNVYENAPLESIRQDFASWVTMEGYTIDKPGNPPRFTHCLYVDQKCLDTLKAFENWIRLDRNGPIQYLACILIDGQVPVDEQAAVTGQGYPGWMYANAGSVPELYETLGQMHLWDPGNDVYVMPPRMYPDMRKMK